MAMLDSGVYAANPHIQRPVQGGVTILPEGEQAGFEDRLGHGTAVCAVLQELAPAADLFAVKIFDARLATSLPVVLRAIDWCVHHEMDIINLSLGTTNDAHRALFMAAIERVCARGSVVVSAFSMNGALMLPGSLQRVVGVVEDAACARDSYSVVADAEGSVHFAACPFPLDIAGVPRERNLRGVSFAVAHVSAQIARMWPEVQSPVDWVDQLRARREAGAGRDPSA